MLFCLIFGSTSGMNAVTGVLANNILARLIECLADKEFFADKYSGIGVKVNSLSAPS